MSREEVLKKINDVPRKVIEIDVYRCCTDSDGSTGRPVGTYLGDTFVHDPDVPGNGPWYLKITQEGVTFELGFGTKAEAVRVSEAVPRYWNTTYEVTVDPWDD